MSVITAVRLSRAPIAALAVVGVFWGGFAGFVPDIKMMVGATDAEFGGALILSSVGAMCAMYLAPRVDALLGRAALPILGLLLCLAFFYPLLASNVRILALVMFGVGASVSILDITANVQISALETKHKIHLMNVNHAMFSFAFAAAAGITGVARKAGLGPADILPLLAIVGLVLTALMWEGAGRLTPHITDATDNRSLTPPWGAILLSGVILFAAFVGENATEAWSALHIERTLGGAPGEGSFGPFVLGIMMGLGRLSGQFIADRLGEARLILWSAILGMIGAAITAVAPTQAVVLVGVSILGLGMAVIVPSVNSILGKLVREEQRSLALSRAWMVGIVGFFIGPAMMGGLSQLFGLRVSFAAVAIMVAAIIPAVLALQKKG